MATMAQTVEEFRQAELDRRDAWDMLNGALVNGMAKNAKRYETWRAGMFSDAGEFERTLAPLLPGYTGFVRYPTAEEWDAALDAVAAQPAPIAKAPEVQP
ncbi:hypothetical protein D3C85_982330 [compost metagenome]